MSQGLPPPQRKVVLKLSSSGNARGSDAPGLSPDALNTLLARARVLGLPLHHDAQVAALLTSLRLREDVPPQLYAAAAAVLGCVYEAAQED